MHTYKPGIAAAMIVAALTFAAGPAAAQPGDPDPDQPPLKIGPFELWPALVFRDVGVDANVFNDAVNPRRDFTATVAPTLQVVVKPPRLRLSYTTGGDFVYFHDFEDERHINRTFGGAGELDLTYFRLFGTLTASQLRERPNSEIDLRARNRVRTYSAGFRVPLGPATLVSISARRGTNRFDPGETFRGVELASELNNETDAIDGALSVAVTPLTTVALTVTSEDDRFDASPLRNSSSLRVAPTVTFTPGGYFTGSAMVGWRRFDTADPQVDDYSGLTASGTVGVVIVERYHVETTFSRDVRYSYESTRPTYVWTSGRGTLRMDLFGGLDVKLIGGRDVMDYRAVGGGSAGRDVVVSYGAGLGYNIRERVRIGVDADVVERTSAEAPRGYTNNRVFATLAWGVRPQ